MKREAAYFFQQRKAEKLVLCVGEKQGADPGVGARGVSVGACSGEGEPGNEMRKLCRSTRPQGRCLQQTSPAPRSRPGETMPLAPCSWQPRDLPGWRGRTCKAVFAGLGDESDAAQRLRRVPGFVISPSSDLGPEDVSICGSAELAVVKWARSKNSHKIIHLKVSFSSLDSKDLKDVESCIGLKPGEQRGRVKYLQPWGNPNKM